LSYVDRSVSANDSELSVESLIENLKNMIMKELFISCVTESSMSLPASSAASSSAALSQSSILVSVSDSPAPAISVPVTSTPATSDFTVSAFITSSPCFKKMLCRLSELYFSFLVASVPEIILIEDDNTVKTILFCSQASLIAFSFFSAEKVVHTLNHKHSVSSDSHHHSSDS
ncbi:hypothetical protein BDDG_12552, partial [Blastomyces dermatitidis ATCC 18188]